MMWYAIVILTWYVFIRNIINIFGKFYFFFFNRKLLSSKYISSIELGMKRQVSSPTFLVYSENTNMVVATTEASAESLCSLGYGGPNLARRGFIEEWAFEPRLEGWGKVLLGKWREDTGQQFMPWARNTSFQRNGLFLLVCS